MARARNIKPGFFKNELLADMPIEFRMLFVGLWTLADREGRIEDRPKRIKLELFPWDSIDIDAGLDALCKGGFIDRYTADGKNVVSICSFLKHQTPHGTEKDSELPDINGNYTVHERGANGYVTGRKRAPNVISEEINVKSGGNNGSQQEDTKKTTVKQQVLNTLNPDLLNPDLLNPESGAAKPAPTARGTRLPADWKIPDSWKTEAKQIRPEWPDHHVQRVADSFRDYWIAKTGSGATKADWLATWRNWCRNDKSPCHGPAVQSGGHSQAQPQTGMRKIPMMPIPGRVTGGDRG